MLLAAHVRAAETQSIQFDNGIVATIYPPEYILAHMTIQRGDETLFLVDDVHYEFVTDISDPIIANKGNGRFHPMAIDEVIAALREIRTQDLTLPTRVFVLPFPRREVLARPAVISSCSLPVCARSVR